MRRATKDGMRQTGYTITIAIVLLALFCLLTGDNWAAGTLAVTALVSVAGTEMLRKVISRRM